MINAASALLAADATCVSPCAPIDQKAPGSVACREWLTGPKYPFSFMCSGGPVKREYVHRRHDPENHGNALVTLGALDSDHQSDIKYPVDEKKNRVQLYLIYVHVYVASLLVIRWINILLRSTQYHLQSGDFVLSCHCIIIERLLASRSCTTRVGEYNRVMTRQIPIQSTCDREFRPILIVYRSRRTMMEAEAEAEC